MKPVRLTMQAFGPYPERVVIDFRDAVEAGLFGIYGQTGSGKSTIFSAMTFALFGEPAKTDQDAPSLRSDHADAGVQTEVEFVFDIGVRRYVVLRRPDQMRPKQRGDGETRCAHEAFLFDATGLALDDIKEGHRGKILAEKKVRDVDTAISDMLGYGAEQFRQIVFLPQGRFETFLSAKTKERLDILRDLFDVSLYRSLLAKLKTDAEVAERHVREEREVCVRRLNSEGFESTDALSAGITEAKGRHVTLQEDEKVARAVFAVAQAQVQEGEKIEAQFKAVEDAQEALAALQADKGDMDALADRVAKAERARSLLDAEGNIADANGAVGEAEEKLKQAQKAAVGAANKEKVTVDALKKEADRAGEIDDLRRQVDEFERHQQMLEKASGAIEAENAALAMEYAAGRELNEALRRWTGAQAKRREKSETLKVVRQIEVRRQDILTRLAVLKSAIAASETFEKIEKDVLAAKVEVEALTSRHETARSEANKAQANFDEAERCLSAIQALHLASKLIEGDPCPVCGATEHPAPATGVIEQAGLDLAFRETKSAWQKADELAHALEQKLTGAQSVLKERQDRLVGLDRPEATCAALHDRKEAERRELDCLGPTTDIAGAEAEIERLDDEIIVIETEREALRTTLSDRKRTTAVERARLEEMLAAVPDALRNRDALVAAREGAVQALTARSKAKEKAEAAATAAREAALSAQKDREAAENVLSLSRERLRKTIAVFQSRLERAVLSDEEYFALKPSIETIDEDRQMVADHRRKLENAKETANRTVEAIQQQVRPDLPIIEAKRREAEGNLTDVTEIRSGAWHRLNHLAKLHDDLAETLRKLDEAEAVSGPLRNLAALMNGDNPQKLDLETFAIGAMFDQVLAAANLRLGPMTGNRYRMERDLEGGGRGRRGLGIQVFDFHTGKARPTTTLSGGETFIAALALALGLADVVESASGKVRLDTIFIDEGFGSLDTENGSGTLDQVLQVLSSLVSQHRAVGLISHVPLVQEAIPNGFYVRKHLAGSSVETRGAV